MIKEEFKHELLNYINGNESLKEEREILVKFKNKGIKQNEAKEILEKIALDLSENEDLQDKVYNILDIVVGWCSSSVRVWEVKEDKLKHNDFYDFQKKFISLKEDNKGLQNFKLLDEKFEWSKFKFDKIEFACKSIEDFREISGLNPFMIDVENQDFYCFNSKFEEIVVFSVHTIVNSWKNFDEFLKFLTCIK